MTFVKMLITGLVCGSQLPGNLFPCICSLRNHRCHYTTLSVNVNSLEAFFSSNEPKKSDLCKRKSHFFVQYAPRIFIIPLKSNEKKLQCLWVFPQNQNDSYWILCNRAFGRKSFFTRKNTEKMQFNSRNHQ